MHTVRVALILMVQIAITITNKIYILRPLQRIEKSVDNQKIHVADDLKSSATSVTWH